MNKFMIIVFLFAFSPLLMNSAFAFNASTTSYTIGSYHTGISGENGTTPSYSFRSLTTYEQGVGHVLTTGYYGMSGFFPSGNWTPVYPPPEQQNPNPPSGPSGDTAGPSGSASLPSKGKCIYNWVCSAWAPSECTDNGVQTRTCTNLGNCTGIEGKPAETKTCVRSATETGPLSVDVYIWETAPGQKPYATISVKLETGITPDEGMVIDYQITDSSGNTFYSDRDVRAQGEPLSFMREFDVSLRDGVYSLTTTARYKNYTSSSVKNFVYSGGRVIPADNTIPAIISNVLFAGAILAAVFLVRFSLVSRKK
jgi:hypothetical protein